ncbi:unnamed protein product, partial [Allacma fusca]
MKLFTGFETLAALVAKS